MLFERLVMYDDRRQAHAAANMALDEALLAFSAEPAVRFYGWARPALSFGYFGKFAEVARGNDGRELVRRWTGGGSVPHGDDLTYSLVVPRGHPLFLRGPRAIYAGLHGAMRAALRTEGWNVEIAHDAAPKISEACFANPVRDDLLLDGRKIAGAAQRRTRHGFLHQGSIQLRDLSPAFRDHFCNALATAPEKRELPPAVLARATALTKEKYATDEWLRRC
jgi:lipoate-protein ligase A